MRMYDIIEKKKEGKALTKEEIEFVVEGFTNGNIKDYQMSALLMGICLQGMNEEETNALTLAMTNSGDVLDLSEIQGIKVDKHSTGGVGDKTTLILAPMVAALSVPVAKMSGRGLGHTGGTIDKLDAFKGLTTSLSKEQFINQVNTIKMAIAGQTANLAPADKKIYALRDVTATVDNMALIASSIMSKKLASGADGIVLDVKSGSGAFMKKEEDAILLAETMVKIGNGLGKDTYGVVSDMDQPLGNAVGNVLEVIEVIETLKGNGPEDLLEVCLVLGSYMLLIAGATDNLKEARKMLLGTIEDGTALLKLKEFVIAQDGDAAYIDDVSLFEEASICETVTLPSSGYVKAIQTDEIGIATMILGGGRETKESIIDLSVGYIIHKKVGDFIDKGEAVATLYGNNADKVKASKERFINAYHLSEEPTKKNKLIKAIITKDGIKRI